MRAALGHVYTVTRHLADRWRPPEVPAGETFATTVQDERLGPIGLGGVLHRGRRDSIVVLIHGLGGSIESGYVRRMAMSAARRGHTVLRLNLRGADRGGADIYHAGLTSDLAAIFAALGDNYRRRLLVGYSLGGHTSLRLAAESPALVSAVVAVCSPLDLAAAARFIDGRRRLVYRRHLLRGLREIYGQSHAAIGELVGVSLKEARSIRTIREWDDRIVAARFGFAGADEYYAVAGVLPLLGDLAVPALMIRANQDPLVSEEAACLAAAARSAELWCLTAGHVGFPSRLAIEERIADWLDGTLAV